MRVLIVEDQPILALELKALLEGLGVAVTGLARDASEAAAAAASALPDLALVDLHLADGLTGPEVAAHLTRAYGCTVIFVSGTLEDLPGDFANAVAAMAKPFDPLTLRAALDLARAVRVGAALGEPPSALMLAPWLRPPAGDTRLH